MWFVGCVIGIVVLGFVFCAMKVKSDSDDNDEKWWEEHENNLGEKEDVNNANRV
jgi:hypothetical protein